MEEEKKVKVPWGAEGEKERGRRSRIFVLMVPKDIKKTVGSAKKEIQWNKGLTKAAK